MDDGAVVKWIGLIGSIITIFVFASGIVSVRGCMDALEPRPVEVTTDTAAVATMATVATDTAGTTGTISEQSMAQPVEHSIRLRNDCADEISVAVYSMNAQREWIASGWYVVKPHDSFDPGLRTPNALVYYYAESDRKTWNGADSQYSATVEIDPKRSFRGVGGVPPSEGTKSVTFIGTEYDDSATDYVRQFDDCQ